MNCDCKTFPFWSQGISEIDGNKQKPWKRHVMIPLWNIKKKTTIFHYHSLQKIIFFPCEVLCCLLSLESMKHLIYKLILYFRCLDFETIVNGLLRPVVLKLPNVEMR